MLVFFVEKDIVLSEMVDDLGFYPSILHQSIELAMPMIHADFKITEHIARIFIFGKFKLLQSASLLPGSGTIG